MTATDWDKFKIAIKKAREMSFAFREEYNPNGAWLMMRINFGDSVAYDLNPFTVNLKTGESGLQYNVFTGRHESVPNIKKHLLMLNMKGIEGER